jgi:4-aminobutyrate aminotransferase
MSSLPAPRPADPALRPAIGLDRAEGDRNTTDARVTWQAAELDAATRAILAEDAGVFLHQALSTPCLNVVTEARGAEIVDAQGRRYLDFHANAVNQVGFANERVVAAIRVQLASLVYSTRRYTNRPAIDLARRLADRAPGDLSRVLFTTSGATAISAAIQLARVATGRHKTVSLWDSFHGATLDALSVSGEAAFRAGMGPLLSGTEHVPPPDPWHCPLGCRTRAGGCDLTCAGYLEYVLDREGDVAAVVAETVRSTPVIPPRGYWERVRAACDRHGALLILDEIPNGLGRTGHLFSCEAFGVVPDILVIGKGLGGGVMPLAALIAREALNVAGDRAIGHFTHEKNPVSCAAGIAVLDELEERDLPARASVLGDRALEQLQELARRHPLVGEVRGIGLLMGVVLARRSDGTQASGEAEAVMYAALSRGLSFKVTMGDVLQLTPPLTVTEAELDRAIAILDDALTQVESETRR